MTTEFIMLPVKQKQVVDKIKAAGFKPNDFVFEPKSNEEFSLTYKTIPVFVYQRMAKPNTGNFGYSPASNGNFRAMFRFSGFGSLIENIDKWFNAIKENIEIGNPWEDIEDIKDTMDSMGFDSYEEMFTATEQEKIAEKLNNLLSYFQILKIDVSKIKDDVEHLKEMSSKISKKDWILLFLGNITGFIFTGLITTEHTSLVWEYVKNLFSGFNIKLLP